MNTKNTSTKIKKTIKKILPYLFIGFMFYFWYRAYRWENLLTEDWIKYPELSNLSTITGYLKALVKIIMAAGFFGTLWILLDNKEQKINTENQ